MRNPLKSSNIRVLLADNHEFIRTGVTELFKNPQHGIDLIGKSERITSTFTLAKATAPDVILLNLNLNDGSTLEHIPQLLHQQPRCKILIFTDSLNHEHHVYALRMGAVGIFTQNQNSELLVKAIRTVHQGEWWVDRRMISNLLAVAEGNHHTKSLLTPRENRIACLCAKGLSAAQIGNTLFISPKTVRNQLTRIYSKLNIKNQLELTLKASELKLYS